MEPVIAMGSRPGRRCRPTGCQRCGMEEARDVGGGAVERVNARVQIRPEVARVEAYIPGESLDAFSARTGVPVERLIKLNSNESPYPPTPQVAEALGAFRQYNLYPDPDAPALITDLAAYVGVDRQYLVVGNGSNELIADIWRVFL